ncbi:MAG: hypothetical protein WAO09_02870 [Candidatus Dormiibacterota bacterium]|jgi:hypothetical protein
MSDWNLYLLVEDHQRELLETATRGRRWVSAGRQTDGVMRRRAAAAMKLLRAGHDQG